MNTKIPLQIDANRVLDLLATQIYQSPLALLRENVQNAYDAILLRRQVDCDLDPIIRVTLKPDVITISDNGIGMTPREMGDNFWRAGHSSKNTPEAAAAGVVGAFGIGAMANFGIASELIVDTTSFKTAERSRSRALKDRLHINRDCIDFEKLGKSDRFGTKVTAIILPDYYFDVPKATRYIEDFVQISTVPIEVNGTVVSMKPVDSIIRRPAKEIWRQEEKCHAIGNRLTADIDLSISQSARIWMALRNVKWSGAPLNGIVAIRSDMGAIRTYRTGFGLATVNVASAYQFGGIVDLGILQPTAGREALTTESMGVVQSLIAEIEYFVSQHIAQLAVADECKPFMVWVDRHRRYELCDNLKIRASPGDGQLLSDVKQRSMDKAVRVYQASDPNVIRAHENEDDPLLILARTNPKRRCERAYLEKYCRTETIADAPVVESYKDMLDLKLEEKALIFRMEMILDRDYFIKASVRLGKITHGLPVLAMEANGEVTIAVSPENTTVKLILRLYHDEYSVFGGMVTDFVRTFVFPRIQKFVPSSSQRGADAFLRSLRRPREIFEYDEDDRQSLSEVWSEYREGKITFDQAVRRSAYVARSAVQVVDRATNIEEVVPNVIERVVGDEVENDTLLDAAPGIVRKGASSSAKLLTIGDDESPLRTYRCFLAITDTVRREIGDFFLQPHSTSIVWGGQRVLYVFLHHSTKIGLYYDLQTRDLVSSDSGGGAMPSCTIILDDCLYIPVPESIQTDFVPDEGEQKRFEVRHDLFSVE